MANFHSKSMGVPLHSSPNHLTASSAIANYSRITLHSFNSADSQALLSENCGAPRADGSLRFSGTATVELDVSLYFERDNAEMTPLFCLTQKTFGLDLQKTV